MQPLPVSIQPGPPAYAFDFFHRCVRSHTILLRQVSFIAFILLFFIFFYRGGVVSFTRFTMSSSKRSRSPSPQASKSLSHHRSKRSRSGGKHREEHSKDQSNSFKADLGKDYTSVFPRGKD